MPVARREADILWEGPLDVAAQRVGDGIGVNAACTLDEVEPRAHR
jgi:hypothetical protein